MRRAVDFAHDDRADASFDDGIRSRPSSGGELLGHSSSSSTPAVEPLAAGSAARARVFISYKRNSSPDEQVALAVFEALSQRHDVFVDQTMLVGARWAERIEQELRLADFLIAFLSEQSVRSEMVEAEITTANALAKERRGRPFILPVRLDYREPFQYPLSAYLNPINWAFWAGESDTASLITELERAISGGRLSIGAGEVRQRLLQTPEPEPLPQPFPAAQPAALELPEGTMDPQSAFYVPREADAVAADTAARQGVTITIKGPRQMGKSSLLLRTIDVAARSGKSVVFLDFQLIDKMALTDADRFFSQFCSWISDELSLDDRVDEYWRMPLGNSHRCTRYMSRYVLRQVDRPIVLAMDEVDSIFASDFRSDFFSMLRSWHNSRQPMSPFKQLDLFLVTSTEPYQLIADLNQSPFNVGEVIDLPDFSADQVADLNRRHGRPLDPKEERRLLDLVGGQPYLVRRALYLVGSNRISADELFARSTDEQGPFGDHLRHHLFRLHARSDLVSGLTQVLRHQKCDDRVFWSLRGAGLVRREAQAVLPRCQLYAEYFRARLCE
jgi:AAA-like domain/TIR domain